MEENIGVFFNNLNSFLYPDLTVDKYKRTLFGNVLYDSWRIILNVWNLFYLNTRYFCKVSPFITKNHEKSCSLNSRFQCIVRKKQKKKRNMHKNILFHAEVQLLSKKMVLSHVFELKYEMHIFFHDVDKVHNKFTRAEYFIFERKEWPLSKDKF